MQLSVLHAPAALVGQTPAALGHLSFLVIRMQIFCSFKFSSPRFTCFSTRSLHLAPIALNSWSRYLLFIPEFVSFSNMIDPSFDQCCSFNSAEKNRNISCNSTIYYLYLLINSPGQQGEWMAVLVDWDWKIGERSNFRDGYQGIEEIKNSILDKFEMPIRDLGAEGK